MLCSGVPYHLIKFRPAKTAQNKNVPKMMGSELHYVDMIFFSLQRENQFIRIHSDLGKDHLTMLGNSSRSHHPKNIISRKLSRSSRLGAVIVTDTVRSIESWWHQYSSCAPLHIHFCMLSLIVRFFKDTLLRFFSILHLKHFPFLCCSGN